MSLYLGYTYSTGLSEDEIVVIDKQVCRNRKLVYIFVRNLPSNAKDKTKKVIIVSVLGVALWFSNVKSSEAIGLSPVPQPAPIMRAISQNSYQEMRIAPIVEERLDKVIFMPSKDIVPFIYLNAQNVYINEQILKKLRGGSWNSYLATGVIGLVILLMVQLGGADAFAGLINDLTKFNAPQPRPPFGPAPSSSSTAVAVIPTRAQEFNDMALKFNEPQSQYVMTRQKALELIAETYSGSMQVTEDFKITDWQAVKHLYHAKGVGVNPEKFEITQKQLMEIGKPGGLPEYVRKGNKLPSIGHIRAYQEALKNICENPSTNRRDDTKYYYKHGVTPTTAFYNGRYVVAFNQTNGDLITGDKQRENVSNRFMADNTLGGLQWIAKWSK